MLGKLKHLISVIIYPLILEGILVTDLSMLFSFRGNTYNPCDDLTLSNCDINDEYITDTALKMDPKQCQDFCHEKYCDIFKFNHTTKNCILLNYDYRQACSTVGLLNVSYNHKFKLIFI